MNKVISNYGKLSQNEAALIYAIVSEKRVSSGNALNAMGITCLSSKSEAYNQFPIDEELMNTSYKEVIENECRQQRIA